MGSLLLLLTSDETGSSGSDKTDLLTSGLVTSDGRWVTNMLMVTTTVWMLDWVHGNTSDSWPVLSLSLGFVPGSVGLEEWLVASLSSGNDANHSSASAEEVLSGSRWKSDLGLSLIIGVADDNGGNSGGSSEGTSVSIFRLNV